MMDSALKYIKLYTVILWLNIKARSTYRTNFIVSVAQAFVTLALQAALIWMLLDRFKDINGWGTYEIGFMLALSKISIGFSAVFLPQVWMMDSIVNSGDLDRILVRPKSPLFLFVFQGFNIQGVGELAAAFALLFYTVGKVDVLWNMANISFLIATVVCSALIFNCVLFILGLTSFWFLSFRSLREFFISIFSNFSPFPVSIYGKGVQLMLTFILPVAFVYYYPSLYFFNKGDLVLPYWIEFCAPAVAAGLLFLCYALWALGLRSYKSAGS